jgi:hypothetical protein
LKKYMWPFFIIIWMTGFSACTSTGGGQNLIYTHGAKLQDRFISVVDYSPQEIEFKISRTRPNQYLYHMVIDEEQNRVSETWHRTQQSDSATDFYIIKMKAKKKYTYEPGKKYRLCVGYQHPESLAPYTNTYNCIIDCEFVLSP